VGKDLLMNNMSPKVDAFISNAKIWPKELEKLRTIILECNLSEELKWGVPCYSYQNSNILIIGELKEYCVLSFFKGVLLADTEGILIKPGENTQTVRLIPFTSVREIVKMAPILKAYIYEAIEVERSGLKVKLKKIEEYKVPEEFQKKLNKSPALKTAFTSLTPGRQRGWLLYFSAPKQSITRESRIEKSMKQILKGKGINDD
jgi:uncharacterized protein YdeI (YjbR/CyaY-like superfamily)